MRSSNQIFSPQRQASLSSGFVSLDPSEFYGGRQYVSGLFVPAVLEKTSRFASRTADAVVSPEAHEGVCRTQDEPQAPLQYLDKATRKQQSRFEKEAEVWKVHEQMPLSTGPSKFYRVFNPDEALKLFNRIDRLHKDDRPRLERVYEHLREEGHLRSIERPSKTALSHLACTQPHMAAVVEFIQLHVELSLRARKPIRIPPIMLVGEAGIGKTHFAQALAKALAAPISVQRLDSDLTGALMLGTDKKWSTAHHGLLFELLCLGRSANPVVVLDEIDKVNRREQQVQASLYSLLEPVSARNLRDISFEFEFDASMVTWIATANDASRLDEPLRSRFKEFHIQVPDAAQCLVLAGEVIRATIRGAGVRGFDSRDGSLARYLAHLTARQISQVVLEAMAHAIKAGRRSLDRQDLPAWVSSEEESGSVTSVQRYLH